jgi:hypothetical protein
MKPRLIILSDLWGKEKSEWVKGYIEILESEFDIKFYDCCELGEVDKGDYSEINCMSSLLMVELRMQWKTY